MENEQVLTVVVVIAVLALIARLIINSQRRGGVNWRKLASIVALAAVFVASLLLFDPYRAETWALGPVNGEADMSGGRVIGREAGPGVTPLGSLQRGVVPIYFALRADSVTHTGYWLIKRADKAGVARRDQLVSQSDTSRTAIKRTTSTFAITRHPDSEADYVGVYRLALPSGEKVLAAMEPRDAHAGVSPMATARRLDGKMAEIAAQDSLVNQQVYALCFDTSAYASAQTRYLAYSAIFALLVTALVGVAARLSLRFLVKKRHR